MDAEMNERPANLVGRNESLLRQISNLGYTVRYDYFGGSGGGPCELGGKKHLFVDLALNSEEQFQLLTSVIQNECRGNSQTSK